MKDLAKLTGPDADLYRALFSPQGTFIPALKLDEAGLPAELRTKLAQQREEMTSLRKITAEKVPVAHGLQEGHVVGEAVVRDVAGEHHDSQRLGALRRLHLHGAYA